MEILKVVVVIPTNPSRSVTDISAPRTRKPGLLIDPQASVGMWQLQSGKDLFGSEGCCSLFSPFLSCSICFFILPPRFLISHPLSLSPPSLYFFCLSRRHSTISMWDRVLVVVLRPLLCLALRNQSHHSQERLGVQHPAPALQTASVADNALRG